MSEQSWNIWFNTQLDLLANGLPLEAPWPKQSDDAPPAVLLSDLQAAARLAEINLGCESKVRANLRTRLAWMAMTKIPNRQTRNYPTQLNLKQSHFRISWLAGLAAVFLIVFLTIFNQPALAMVQHILGFGYLPEVGFFQMSSSLLLKGPVELQQNDHQILVLQGVALQREYNRSGVTWLWLAGNIETLSLEDTWLDLSQSPALYAGTVQNRRLQIQALDRIGSNQIRLAFEMLPTGTTQAVLNLSRGWRIPLEWIRAAEAGLAPTRVSALTAPHIPTGESTITPCLNLTAQIKLCAQAAYLDEQKTHLLLELQPLQNGISMIWDSKIAGQAKLFDENHKIYPIEASSAENMDGANSLILQFAAVPDGITDVTLHLPGVQIQQDGKEEWITGPFELPLRLPDRGPRLSPTPSVIRTSERRPVPTPVITSRP